MSTRLRDHLQAVLAEQYELERELGGGGMSRVFVAVERALERRVVIKVLPPELAAGISIARFRQEMRLAAALQHPLVVPVLSSGEQDGLLFYTMPLIAGKSLRQRLDDGGRLAVPEVVHIMRDIADALGYAHAHGIVHRDLKPGNILLAEQHALVTDFGIAKALSAATDVARLTSTGVALGTPAYMAPEQALADAAVDHRADLYALGCLTYELLVGAPPFPGRGPVALLAAHATERPAPLSERDGTIPSALGQLVMQLLEKVPTDRPRSAGEVMRALDAIDASLRRDTTPHRAVAVRVGPRRRYRTLIGAACALVVPAIGGWWVAHDEPSPSPRLRRVAVVPFANETGDAELDALGRVAAGLVAQEIAQTGLVEVSDPSAAAATTARRPRTAAEARAAALTTEANTVIWGTYYAVGDSVYYQVRISDAIDGHLLRALPPEGAPRTTPASAAALERIRYRVAGALAIGLDPRFGWIGPMSQPPSVEAYQSLVEGYAAEARGDPVAAWRHYTTAAASDSTFTIPLVRAVSLYSWMPGGGRLADSLARTLEARRDPLPAYDRAWLEIYAAELRGNWPAALEASRRLLELTPESDAARAALMYRLYVNNRPREAAALGYRRDSLTWSEPTMLRSLHLLGRDDEVVAITERARARRGADLVGVLSNAIGSYAALGRDAELRSLLDQMTSHPAPGSAAPAALLRAAYELRAHGFDALADTAAQRGLTWLAERNPEEAGWPGSRSMRAFLLYQLRRWTDAREQWEQLAASSRLARAETGAVAAAGRDDAYQEHFLFQALTGSAAASARLGDTARAERTAAELAAAVPAWAHGQSTFGRAKIAAALGRRDEAVRLLRQAFAEGFFFNILYHSDPDLHDLRGHPGYDELLRPKG